MAALLRFPVAVCFALLASAAPPVGRVVGVAAALLLTWQLADSHSEARGYLRAIRDLNPWRGA